MPVKLGELISLSVYLIRLDTKYTDEPIMIILRAIAAIKLRRFFLRGQRFHIHRMYLATRNMLV